jgi:hypothetical protein
MLFASFPGGDALAFVLSILLRMFCFPKNRWDLLCELHKSAKSIDANEARIKRLMHTVCREMPGIEDVFLKQCLSHHQAITAHFPARRHRHNAEIPNNQRNPISASATVRPRRGVSLVSTQLQFEQATSPAHAGISQPQVFGRDAHDADRSSSMASSGRPIKSSHARLERNEPTYHHGEWFRNERALPKGKHANINKQEPSIKHKRLTTKDRDSNGLCHDAAHAANHHERPTSSLGAHTEVMQPAAVDSSMKIDSKMRMRALLKWQVKKAAHTWQC